VGEVLQTTPELDKLLTAAEQEPARLAAQRPFKHRVLVRRTEFTLPHIFRYRDDIAIHELCSALVSDEERNTMIIEDVLEAVGLGRSPVVLTE
jgi:hypothetical protein